MRKLGLFAAFAALSLVSVPIMAQSASTVATTTSVTSASADTLLLAANSFRTGVTISNDSTAILYILLGTGVASATNYTYAIDAKGNVAAYKDIPSDYKGAIRGFWASANGSAKVTERTR